MQILLKVRLLLFLLIAIYRSWIRENGITISLRCKLTSSTEYSGWKKVKIFFTCVAILLVDAGLQGVLVFGLRKGYNDKHLEWPLTLVGAVAFILLISGYMPIPFELIRRRGRVVGIDFIFLIIDWFGAFFSLLSLGSFKHYFRSYGYKANSILVAQNTFDPLFGTLYALCACIEMSMFVSHGIWLLRTRHLRRMCTELGVDFDAYPPAVEWQNSGIKVPCKQYPSSTVHCTTDTEASADTAAAKQESGAGHSAAATLTASEI
jgi:hypothetical protein